MPRAFGLREHALASCGVTACGEAHGRGIGRSLRNIDTSARLGVTSRVPVAVQRDRAPTAQSETKEK
jgi:hypothetical protein